MFLTCPESFSTISCRYFSKWRLKIFWGGNHLPLTFELWRLTLPILGGYPRVCLFVLSHQNDRKGCKRDVLDARGHFLLRFCAAGDKPSGGGNHPAPLGRTRVKVSVMSVWSQLSWLWVMLYINEKGTPSNFILRWLITNYVNHYAISSWIIIELGQILANLFKQMKFIDICM